MVMVTDTAMVVMDMATLATGQATLTRVMDPTTSVTPSLAMVMEVMGATLMYTDLHKDLVHHTPATGLATLTRDMDLTTSVTLMPSPATGTV